VIRIRLPHEESQRLDQAFREEADPKYRDRIQIVRLASRDRPHKDIAADLAITPRTVQRWLNAYLERGLGGIRPRQAKGKPGKIPAELAEEVKRWVIEGPAKQGLDRANWTHEELADHLLKAKGVRTSRAAVGRFCRKLGIRLYRPTYHYERGNPDKQEQARQDIAALKKKPRQARKCCSARTRRASRRCRRWRPLWGSKGTGRWWRRATTRTCCTSSA
jgi:transposase